jgi:RNA polymerase sigma-70 factor (ECF subfamily)
VPGTKREVLVWIWYPAPPAGSTHASDYVPAEVRLKQSLPGGFPLLRWLTRDAPWLYAVARNLHVSYCRSRLVEESHAGDLFGLWPSGTWRSSPFDETAATEFERRLESAIASLPAWSREVLLLVAVEGLRPAEAAEVCGITPDALRQRLSRARAQLAGRLETAGVARAAILREVTP